MLIKTNVLPMMKLSGIRILKNNGKASTASTLHMFCTNSIQKFYAINAKRFTRMESSLGLKGLVI